MNVRSKILRPSNLFVVTLLAVALAALAGVPMQDAVSARQTVSIDSMISAVSFADRAAPRPASG